jgi:hypothetical protein
MGNNYLVVKVSEDGFVEPFCVVDDYSKYDKYGYEIHKILKDGTLKLIRDYDTVTDEYIGVFIWNSESNPEEESPKKIIRLLKGDRYNVTKEMIEKWKKEFNFSVNTDELYLEMRSSGYISDDINNEWIVIGEGFDDDYPIGY